MARTLLVAGSLLLLVPVVAHAQHAHSPYSGTQSEGFPTLSDEEVRQLREGDGMGLARPAELNRYPGPKHALELTERLELSSDQRTLLMEIRARMLERAIAKGEEVLQAEQHLAGTFAGGDADEPTVRRMTSHIASLRGELQAIHLLAHLETRAVLTPAQIDRYDQLRGYGGEGD